MENQRVFDMPFSKVYGLLVAKAERKGRTKDEVHQLASWLTGYSPADIEELALGSITYGAFFRNAPDMNPQRECIKGVICGVRVENVEDPLMREIRRMDKLVDDLAKGKPIGKIIPR